MHDVDRTQLEAAEGYRSPHSGEFGPGSDEFGKAGRFDESAGLAPEHQSSLGEQQDMEFAAQVPGGLQRGRAGAAGKHQGVRQ
jgi:hypothetical protein